jgi:cytochrome P450 family 142 subfamily A polypeptide 1
MRLAGVFFERFEELRKTRDAGRADDLVSLMLSARDDGSVLRDDGEVGMEGLLLLNGGSDTTRHVISGAMLALLQHPDQLSRLAQDPDLMPTAVEEFIRWVTPILNMRRTATRDLDLAGTPVREGDEILMMFSSANRDETKFEAPERFDVTRDPNPHLAFGLGTHFCLGASLARLELRVAFEELLRRLPDLHLAPGFEPTFVPNAFVRGLGSLELEFTPER